MPDRDLKTGWPSHSLKIISISVLQKSIETIRSINKVIHNARFSATGPFWYDLATGETRVWEIIVFGIL